MSDVVIGVDPGSKKHGVAVYRSGVLCELLMLETMALAGLAANEVALVSVEEVIANKFVYGRNTQKSKAAQSKVAMDTGRCQQAQVELVRVLEWYGTKYKLHKPQAGNWATRKDRFERFTGWKGRSNKDTRSAAFFGFLEVGRK